MNDKYCAETLKDGKLAIYNKVTGEKLTICNNTRFMVAWMCIEEDYTRKLDIIKRIMLCEDSIEVDSIARENISGREEFNKWFNKIKYMDKPDYYKAIDTMYTTAMKIAKTYYIKDFQREDNFYATNLG